MKTLLIGSCFSGNIGEKMLGEGRDVMINPFGTIFNPASIASSLERLISRTAFTAEECVKMGAGSDLWGSFNHYTKFARPSKEEFLDNANTQLERAAEYFRECERVILTFGTAWFWRHKATAESSACLAPLFPHKSKIVSNCLKIKDCEFSRERLCAEDIFFMYRNLFSFAQKNGFDLSSKQFIFTVSPIRHLMDGEHENTLSKAILHIGIDKLLNYKKTASAEHTGFLPSLGYFPAYEIMIDTLRDHRWYAADNIHPSEEAIETIWRAFKEWETKTDKCL